MSASNQVGAFNYAVPSFSNFPIKNITAAYLVSPSDNNFIVNCSANTFTVALPSAASLPIGFNITIWNTGTGVITIDPNGTETIDVQTTLLLQTGEGLQIVCDGANFQTGSGKELRQYSEKTAVSNTRPSATGSASFAIGVGATTAGGRAFAIGWGTSASPDYSAALGLNSSGNGAIVPGISATGAMALGGSYASGTDSFAAGIGNNTSTYGAQGANSVAIGRQAKATVTSAIAIGDTTQATGSGGYCLAIGYQSQATSPGAIAIGFQYYGAGATLASGGSSVAIGDHVNATERFSFASGNGALAAQIGKEARASGFFAAIGDAQYGKIVLRIATTDATATKLTSNAAAAGTTNQLILANNQAMVVTGTVICRQSVAGSDKASGWTFTAVIRRGANAASTALVAAVTPILVAQDLSLATTVLAITADTTNGGLAVTVTGIAATNLRWVATLETSECTYA